MFEAFLKQHDRAAWARIREALPSSIHEVDRDATRIWFHFFPLALAEAFAQTDRAEPLSTELRLVGSFRLAQQIDTSHRFLYGHRYWPGVKATIIKRVESAAPPPSLDLAAIIRDIAREVASAASVEESLLVGIVAAGVMTLQQVGLPAFRQVSPAAEIPHALSKKTPAQILVARKKDDSQGIMGLVRGIKSHYTVTFDEGRDDARFALINRQHLTTAAANDPRDYSSGSRPCIDGPIPVQCRSGSCGTCWVGILGGADKLSAVDALEARRMKEFGYINSTQAHPPVRLACMAVASGNVTIVIPPWNGVLGKAGLGSP